MDSFYKSQQGIECMKSSFRGGENRKYDIKLLGHFF